MALGALLALSAIAQLALSWFLYKNIPANIRDFTISDWCAFFVSVVFIVCGFFTLVHALLGGVKGA